MSQGKAAFAAIVLIVLFLVAGALSDYSARSTRLSTPAADVDRGGPNESFFVSSASRAPVVPTMSATPSPLPTETADRFADLHGSETAVELSRVQLDQERQELELQLLRDSHTSTAGAQMTSTEIAAVAGTHAANAQSTANIQATGTSAAATWTAVPLTETAMVMTQQVEDLRLTMKKVQLVAWPALLFLIALGCAVLGWLWLQKRIAAQHFQQTQIQPDDKGRYPAIPADVIPGKSKVMVDLNLAHRAVTDPQHDDLTAEQALANAADHRQLEATRAIANSPTLMRQLLRKQPVTGVTELPPGNVEISQPVAGLLVDNQIVTPPWSLMNSWDGKGGIPYGLSARGLERVSLQQVPHGGIFGQTGKGKSRYFLRPFIAGAIASGQRVVILGKQADFWPFAQHPNVKMIAVRHITQEAEAARYAEYLKRIVEEMNRRDDYLTSHQVSTWDRAGRENTLVILDELGNALDMMPGRIREDAYRWVQGLVKEGRKAGFNVWLASQRAVGVKSIVEQLGRAVFYLADADASRHALGIPGAETLSDGHFLAKFQGLRKCAAFDPTDEELTAFLQGRQVQLLEPVDWIDGEVIGDSQEPEPAPAAETPADPEEQQIRNVLLRMIQDDKVSMRQVEREVWGKVRGGQYYEKVMKVWKDIKGATTTSSGMPESGAVAPL